MAIRFISDLVGTLQTYFRIGTLRLKNDTNVLAVKNVADNAYYPVALSQVQLKGSSSGSVTLTAPAAAGSQAYILPGADGSTNQVLATNGSYTLSWASVATGTTQIKSETELISHGDTSPKVMFTPPANAHIQKCIVDVETAFDGTSPSMSIGVSGGTSRYMTTTDIDLTLIGVYEVAPMYEEDGSPDEIIVSFVAGAGHAAGSARVTVEYANPG